MHHYAQFILCWVWSPGLHACQASILLTEAQVHLKAALFQACISMGWQAWPESGTVDTYRVPNSSLPSLSSVSLLQTALQGPQRLLPRISFSLLTANTAWTAPGNLPEDKGGSERGE